MDVRARAGQQLGLHRRGELDLARERGALGGAQREPRVEQRLGEPLGGAREEAERRAAQPPARRAGTMHEPEQLVGAARPGPARAQRGSSNSCASSCAQIDAARPRDRRRTPRSRCSASQLASSGSGARASSSRSPVCVVQPQSSCDASRTLGRTPRPSSMTSIASCAIAGGARHRARAADELGEQAVERALAAARAAVDQATVATDHAHAERSTATSDQRRAATTAAARRARRARPTPSSAPAAK